MEKLIPMCTADENEKWYSHCGKQYVSSSKKLNIELAYDISIQLLVFNQNNWKQRLNQIFVPPMFLALFTTAKNWKQPKCPSTDEWINKMWYIPAMNYYSVVKRNKILIHATRINFENIWSSQTQIINIVWFVHLLHHNNPTFLPSGNHKFALCES